MLLFYVLSPIHKEVYSFIHSISHHIESNSNVKELNHQHNQNKVNHHHEHSFTSHHVVENEESHHDIEVEQNHAHELLSFLSSVFTSNDSQNNSEKQIVETKLDKHIIPIRIINPEELPSITQLTIWFYSLKIDQMGYEVNTPPPKSFIT